MNANVENLPTVTTEQIGTIVEAVIVRGDLERLTPEQRTTYYNAVCNSMGINPLTRPLEFIKLNGKLTLYALKNCTDQLRKIYGVSVIDMDERREGELIVVTVKVRDATGRTDISKGALTLKGLAGENLANAIMKAETKAKRRATLSVCGLGFLDETEVETLPDAVPRYTKTKQASKDLYAELQTEVHALTTAIQVQDWLTRNASRLALLPHDWEDFLRTACQDIISSEPQETWDDPPPRDDTPPEWDSKWDALGPVKQAGILCDDPAFQTFIRADHALDAAAIVRKHCGVKSRKDIPNRPGAALLWRQLVADYRAWQREPAIVDDVPPRQPEAQSRAAQTEAGPATHASHTRAGPAEVRDEMLDQIDDALWEAACKGVVALDAEWAATHPNYQAKLQKRMDEVHRPRAMRDAHHR